MRLTWLVGLATATAVGLEPICVQGRHFANSVTGEPFFIRGVDYQPGGSSAYGQVPDPLADEQQCARDIYLFQQLGVNTVRVYTVDPAVNHDKCMTMLAAAGIYLVLDVNSPRVGESLNRYEPWTTYTPTYLRHVFQVVDEFSGYNNTLGFFVGNEIVNDERSASVSPVYIRAVARDIKDYLYHHSPRAIPVGYSAADDLRYRQQLTHFLTCGPDDSAVDFYGVNTYQWCGRQTFVSSGYDALVRDHAEYTIPIFFSEFGCNLVRPRIFQEVEAMFSSAMTSVFSGGLAYEFTQETNNYGLVSIDESTGDARMLPDFSALRKQYNLHHGYLDSQIPLNGSVKYTPSGPSSLVKLGGPRLQCKGEYTNVKGLLTDIPDSFGTDMIRNGVGIRRGTLLASVLDDMPVSEFKVFNTDGTEVQEPRIEIRVDFRPELEWQSAHGSTYQNAAYGSSSSSSSLHESKSQNEGDVVKRPASGSQAHSKSNAPRNSPVVPVIVAILVTSAPLFVFSMM